jgi:hypothetical protein
MYFIQKKLGNYEIKGLQIRVITKLPNTEQSSKGKGKTRKSTNRQNEICTTTDMTSTTAIE